MIRRFVWAYWIDPLPFYGGFNGFWSPFYFERDLIREVPGRIACATLAEVVSVKVISEEYTP